MRRVTLFSFSALAALGIIGLVDQRAYDAGRQRMISAVDPQKVDLKPAPIRKDWLIAGTPTTQAAEIAHSDDGTTQVYVWRTTAARFHWNYEYDEVVSILDGEVFIKDESGEERHLVAGDTAFFPEGAKTTWFVPDHLRKIATVKKALPGPIASAMRWLRAAKRSLKPESVSATL